MRETLRKYQNLHPLNLWHCEWTPYVENLCNPRNLPVVVVAHNIESLIWKRYAEHETNPCKRWYIHQQWKKYERFEREIFNKVAMVVSVSPDDAIMARNRFDAPHVAVVSNGVDVEFFYPCRQERNPKTILFLGSLDWRPNQDAIQILLSEIMPQLLRREPSCRLQMVGRNPPDWLVGRINLSPNTELHKNVPDVRPFLWQCGIMVVPLRIGGG